MEYGSVWDDLSVEKLPPGNVVLLQGVRVVVPGGYRKVVLEALHEYHQTADAMVRLGKTLIYWPTFKNFIINARFVRLTAGPSYPLPLWGSYISLTFSQWTPSAWNSAHLQASHI